MMNQITQHFGGGFHYSELSKEDMDIFLMMYPLFEKRKGKYYYKDSSISKHPLIIEEYDSDVIVTCDVPLRDGTFLMVNFELQLGQSGEFTLSTELVEKYNDGVFLSDETVLDLYRVGIIIKNNIPGTEFPMYDVDAIIRKNTIKNIINE